MPLRPRGSAPPPYTLLAAPWSPSCLPTPCRPHSPHSIRPRGREAKALRGWRDRRLALFYTGRSRCVLVTAHPSQCAGQGARTDADSALSGGRLARARCLENGVSAAGAAFKRMARLRREYTLRLRMPSLRLKWLSLTPGRCFAAVACVPRRGRRGWCSALGGFAVELAPSCKNSSSAEFFRQGARSSERQSE